MYRFIIFITLATIRQTFAIQGLRSSPVTCVEPDGTLMDISQTMGFPVDASVKRCITCVCQQGILSCENRAEICNQQPPTIGVQQRIKTNDQVAPTSTRNKTRATSGNITSTPLTTTTTARIPVRFLLTLPPKPKNLVTEEELMEYAGDEPATEPDDDFTEVETTTQSSIITEPPTNKVLKPVEAVEYRHNEATRPRHEMTPTRQYSSLFQQGRNSHTTSTTTSTERPRYITTTSSTNIATMMSTSKPKISNGLQDQLPSRLNFYPGRIHPENLQASNASPRFKVDGDRLIIELNLNNYDQPQEELILLNWVLIANLTFISCSTVIIFSFMLMCRLTFRNQASVVGSRSSTAPKCMEMSRSFVYN